jgi:hypothetical protein
MKCNHQMTLFFIFLFSCCVLSFKHHKWNSSLDDEIYDLKTLVENYELELNDMDSKFKSYKFFLNKQSLDYNNLVLDLNDKFTILDSSKKQYKRIYDFYLNITSDYEKDKIANKEVFEKYQQVLDSRKERGVSEINKLLNNFLSPNKTKETLTKIISILDRNEIKATKKENKLRKSTFLKTEKNAQFSSMRIWSSFRLEEKIKKSFEKDLNRIEIIRGIIAGFYASIPSSYCWVHESNLGTFDISIPDSTNLKKITTLVYNTTTSFEAEEKAGLFIEKCKPGDQDCTFFCSSSDCESIQDFYTRKFENIKYLNNNPCHPNFEKKGYLCYPICEKIGMITCEVGICSFSTEGCKFKQADMNIEMIESFVDFLGHIYSLKIFSPFGWTNPDSLELDLKVFKKYDKINSKRLSILKTLIKNPKYYNYFYENLKKNTNNFIKFEDKDKFSNFFEYNSELFKSLFTDTLNRFPNNLYLNKLGSCDLKFFDELLVNKDIELSSKDLESKEAQIDCFRGFGSFLKNLEPYMLLGYASDLVKPLCPFALLEDK